MPARHGGPGTYPAHDRAGTLDTNLTSTTSRSQQTHCADSQPATCPGPPGRQTPAPPAAPRPGAVRTGTGRHTAREAAGLTAAAARWPGQGRRTRNPGSRSVIGVRVCDTASGRQLLEARHGTFVTAAAVSPDGTGWPPAGGSAAALSVGHRVDAVAQTGMARDRASSLIVHRQNQRSACGFLVPTVSSSW